MQLKLKKREDVSISSWINDKPITNQDWEVFSHEEANDDTILLVLLDRQSNNQVKIEIKKYVKHENSEAPNS